MTTSPIVSVCVCTYRRPSLLAALLSSLAEQMFPLEQFEVVVVDNDKGGTGRLAVEEARQRWPGLQVRYEIEPQSGISHARNRTVGLAIGTYLAFIDDDEVACPNWLADLVKMQVSTDASAVLGPVLPIFPPQSREWVQKSRFFERPRFRSMTVLDEDGGRAGNALVLAAVARSRGPEVFAIHLARSGGEDHDFFKWIVRQGGTMVWCDTAEVREEVPLSRQTLSFMLERSFRSATTYWRGRYAENNNYWAFTKAGQGIVGGIFFLVVGLVLMPKGLAQAAPRWCKAFQAFGRVGALLNLRSVHYGG